MANSSEEVNNSVALVDDGEECIVSAVKGETLLDVIRRAGKWLPSSCGGHGTCGKCEVTIAGVGKVLACRYNVVADCRVVLPRQRRVGAVTHEATAIVGPHCDSALKESIESGIRHVRYRGQTVWSGPVHEPIDCYGIAIDIGTTTVVVYLVDLHRGVVADVAAFLNPQTAFGHDVISRISYASRGYAAVKELQEALLCEINKRLCDLCAAAGVEADSIVAAVVVGNTVMVHLFWGIDPSPIGTAPYTPPFVEERNALPTQVGLAINPSGIVRSLPCVSGYVGADIVAGLAVTPIAESARYSLFLDIGTNGEIACGNRDGIICCSTAAGPAFEGRGIACGVISVEGAVAHVRNGKIETVAGAPAVGICGSGLIDAVAMLLDRGIVDDAGFMEKNFVLVERPDTAVDRDISITPGDIRQLQLGKAAIRAGVNVILREARLDASDVERVYLAGGFGSSLDPESILRIGLLPENFRGKIVALGNSAGLGAQYALRSEAFDAAIRRVVALARYLELSTRKDFNDEFIKAMTFV